jgi:hypothetical protein
MTISTASPRLAVDGDTTTYDRAAALQATRHLVAAFKALHERPSIGNNDLLVELVYDRVADLLGGPHWLEIATDLVEEVLQETSDA